MKGSVSVIVLTGFMGAGKSTVGRLLAGQLDWPFVDADDAIESAAGLTIAEIFMQYGEPRFRELEHQTIRQLVENDRLVLALGGGAIEDDRTRALLLTAPGTRLIHLEASLQTGLTRCEGTDSIRPVLANRPLLESRYEHRLPLYRQAHHSIPVDHLTSEEVAAAILSHLYQNSYPSL